jgi:hypothetical protein
VWQAFFRPRRFLLIVLIVAVLALLASMASPGQEQPAVPKASGRAIDFNRQIRPILSENCFQCHGPDEQQRKAKLRLDTRDGAVARLRGSGHAVVPGQPAESELLARIQAADEAERMPPAKTKKRLTPEQVELLRQWIAEGAPYAQHWAFIPPQRPALPALKMAGAARNAIDRFVLARLERDGLKQAAEADRVTLIRRVTLDLTGLPPTPEEVDAFLADSAVGAYERVVERLLKSPHYGERMAVDWLDAARFADTHGYHIDAGRDMSLWREWIIDAFNTNLPFDRFTIEQLAGDLLPNATGAQKIASGFNRNHMINFEGGAIPEEYHNAYIVDRVNTTATVWLGLTLNCCQCHDHKYDPFTQKEFYQLYAFFHNVPESGLDGAKGNAAPLFKVPSKAQQLALEKIDWQIRELEAQLKAPTTEPDAGQLAWEKSALASGVVPWKALEPKSLKSTGGATFAKQPDGSTLVAGANPATDTYTIVADVDLAAVTAIRLEALPDGSFKANGPGRSVNGNFVLTSVRATAGGAPIAWKAASADFTQQGFDVRTTISSDAKLGWAIHPEVGKARTAIFSFAQPVKNAGTLSIQLDFHSQYGQHQIGRFRVSVTDAAQPHQAAPLPAEIVTILKVPAEQRTAAQKATLRAHYLQQIAPDGGPANPLAALRKQRAQLEAQFPTAMVMQEMPKPRETFMLIRGEYNKKGEKVHAALPAALPPLAKGEPLNRLGLARWLVGREQPLTSRVIVNRIWQTFFGTGLVKTAEDFGSQGELPSHPELLEWLAAEFMEPTPAPEGSDGKQRWDVKHLVRQIVTSATYRQSSVVTKELLARDPENRLLARGPRLRLQAEFIRDQALAISGLLNRDIGGASVSPYQPAGLWQELASRSDSKNWSAQFFVQSHGKDLYRRTMYTFWKRTSPPPQLVTFDAPDREVCTVRRSRTNTPLQALVLMNDPTYVEASRKLAERMMRHAKAPEDRLAFAFRLATARQPSAKEIGILTQTLARQLDRYRQDEKAARKLLAVGESPIDESLPAVELAAYAMVASAILNLDETVTKN